MGTFKVGDTVVAWQAVYPDGRLFGQPVKDAPPYFVEWNAAEGHPVRPLVFGDVATAGSGEAVGYVAQCEIDSHREARKCGNNFAGTLFSRATGQAGVPLYAGAPPAASQGEALMRLADSWTTRAEMCFGNGAMEMATALRGCAEELRRLAGGEGE